MRAKVGDVIRIRPARVGEPAQRGDVVAVRDPEGRPPYVVRWRDAGPECIFFPGPDATVDRAEPGSDRSPGRLGVPVLVWPGRDELLDRPA